MFFSKPRGPFKLDWVGENFFVDPCKHENRVLFLFITTHQLRFPPYKDLYISPPPMAHTTKKPGKLKSADVQSAWKKTLSVQSRKLKAPEPDSQRKKKKFFPLNFFEWETESRRREKIHTRSTKEEISICQNRLRTNSVFPQKKGEKAPIFFNFLSPPPLPLLAGRKEEREREVFMRLLHPPPPPPLSPLSPCHFFPLLVPFPKTWNGIRQTPHLMSLKYTIIFHKYGRNRVARAKKYTKYRMANFTRAKAKSYTAVFPKTARKKNFRRKN